MEKWGADFKKIISNLFSKEISLLKRDLERIF
jgi:hypothetical protein